jgi:hypothetical protein
MNNINRSNVEQTIADILTSYSASYWLKDALNSALQRDVVDAARDAKYLASLLDELANKALGR